MILEVIPETDAVFAADLFHTPKGIATSSSLVASSTASDFFSHVPGYRFRLGCCEEEAMAFCNTNSGSALFLWVRLFYNDTLLPQFSGLGLASQRRRSLAVKAMFMLPRLKLQESVGPGRCASVPAGNETPGTRADLR
jgi:hypothetical protein